jgi:hypothetical protein
MASVKRKKTPAETETDVLLKSVRRCTMCFHLSGDLTEKHGQIAHLDQDRSNFDEDNLAFMCLVQHTLFDSRTSQHKNYTMKEVKAARSRLHEAILQNKHLAPPADIVLNQRIVTDQRFFEQRRQLAETATIKKIFSKPRWQISICPTEFMEARFQDLSHCEHFIEHNAPRSRRFADCPCVNRNAIERDPNGEWIAGEVDHAPDPPWSNLERWVLFRSGLFLHNRALVEHERLGNNLHHLEVIRLVTQVFQLAARMARDGVLSPEGVIRIQLHNVAGRGLLVPDVSGSFWAQEKEITVERIVTPPELEARDGRDIALAVAVDIYRRFRWNDPPMEKLAEEQPH